MLIFLGLGCEDSRTSNPDDLPVCELINQQPEYVQQLYTFFAWYKSQMPAIEQRGLTDTIGGTGDSATTNYVTTANPDYTYWLQSSNRFTKHYCRSMLDRQNAILHAAIHKEMPAGHELPAAPALFVVHSSENDCLLNHDSIPLLSFSATDDTAQVAVMLWDTAWFTLVKRDTAWQIENYQPIGSRTNQAY